MVAAPVFGVADLLTVSTLCVHLQHITRYHIATRLSRLASTLRDRQIRLINATKVFLSLVSNFTIYNLFYGACTWKRKQMRLLC